MPIWQEFSGGFYQALSQVFASDQAINVYTETRQVPGSAKTIALFGTPGLTYFATATTTEGRGWYTLNGQTWTVVGTSLYEINVAAATVTFRATIPDDGKTVSFAGNGEAGNQLGVVGGGDLTVLHLVTLAVTTVSLPFPDPVMIVFQDGYGLINQGDSPITYFSGLEDLTAWDPLDFFTRSGTADNVVGLAVSRDRLTVYGSKTTTDYYDSGDADTPWVPYPGTTSQVGLVAAQVQGLYNDVRYWVAESAKGQRRVVRATDPTPEEISTPPINDWLARCPTLSDAEMLIYEQGGHPFVCITAPSSPDPVQTYCFDVRENLWHARAGWDDVQGAWTRWRARGSTVASGIVLVGDYSTGDLYTLDLDTYTDNGEILKRQRAAPYLSGENQIVGVDQFELGMQAGVGLTTGQGSAPTAELELSRDGGHTWVSAGSRTLGAIGRYGARCVWHMLGSARADRLIFRVSQTDPVKTAWMGAWINLSQGTGQR